MKSNALTRLFLHENPVFVIMLGMCPTLAVTTNAMNGIGMGTAVLFVLLGSNLLVSMVRKITPNEIRIPVFIVIIATFVTIIDLCMAAFTPDLHKALGIFIPLIVVNCIILGRAEAFACKNNLWASALDAIHKGIGFTFALVLIGCIREILGNGSLFGFPILGPSYTPMLMMVLPPGAFILLGFLIAVLNRKAE